MALRARIDWSFWACMTLWFLLLVNFNGLALNSGDAGVQFGFVRRMFGDAPTAVGYYFGLALVEAPLYAIGKVLDHLGLHTVAGHTVEESTVAFGLGLLTLIVWPLLRSLFRGLQLPHVSFALLAAGLGTPFFYYAAFSPGKNHALDAVLFTGVVYLTYRYFSRALPERWTPYAIGAVLGLSYTVRYFSGAEAVTLVAVLLLWRRFRHAAEIAVTSAVGCGLLFIIPHAFGVEVFTGGNYSPDVLTFAPLNPFRMLFTNHRGYLVWSPVAALAVIGLAHLFRRRPEHRRFLVATVVMAVGLMSAYVLVPFWDGTFAFGQRFFTPLFPVVAIGLGGLLDAVPRAGIAAASAAAAWTIYLCLNLVIIGGPQYLSTTSGGATDLALVAPRTNTSLGAYAFGVWHRSHLLGSFIAWPFGHTASRQ